MSLGFDYSKFFVMYVDDEAQSLKYFKKNFGKDFRVITAENTAAALEILDQQGHEIGVLMTDQRMPGAPGTELLNQAKQRYPEITRILVTAYSDLDTAVDSVNDGGAFRYLTKPWDMRELKGVLLRAMEFFLLQRDRNQLVKQKILASQQIITLDRLRSIATFLGSAARNMPQLADGLQGYSRDACLLDCATFNLDSVGSTDLWNLSRQESVRLIERMQQLETPALAQQQFAPEQVDWRGVFDKCAGEHPGSGSQLDVPAGIGSHCDSRLANAFADSLLRSCVPFPNATIKLQGETEGVKVTAEFVQEDDSSGLKSLFASLNGHDGGSVDLLDAYLAMSAMGGSSVGVTTENNGFRLTFSLDKEPSATPAAGFDAVLFERIYSTVEEG